MCSHVHTHTNTETQTIEEIFCNLHLELITADKHYGSPGTLITACWNTEEICKAASDMILNYTRQNNPFALLSTSAVPLTPPPCASCFFFFPFSTKQSGRRWMSILTNYSNYKSAMTWRAFLWSLSSVLFPHARSPTVGLWLQSAVACSLPHSEIKETKKLKGGKKKKKEKACLEACHSLSHTSLLEKNENKNRSGTAGSWLASCWARDVVAWWPFLLLQM